MLLSHTSHSYKFPVALYNADKALLGTLFFFFLCALILIKVTSSMLLILFLLTHFIQPCALSQTIPLSKSYLLLPLSSSMPNLKNNYLFFKYHLSMFWLSLPWKNQLFHPFYSTVLLWIFNLELVFILYFISLAILKVDGRNWVLFVFVLSISGT